MIGYVDWGQLNGTVADVEISYRIFDAASWHDVDIFGLTRAGSAARRNLS
jgi:hypothetical protein